MTDRISVSAPAAQLVQPKYRGRSDTILTTSSGSSSSSPYPQTPQTPSILGVLGSHGRGRADSYGFEQIGKALFEDTLPELRLPMPAPNDPTGESLPTSFNQVLSETMPDLATQSNDRSHHLHLDSEGSADGLSSSIPPIAVGGVEDGKSKAKVGVRARLERSRSSFKEVFGIKRPSSPDQSSTSTSSRTDDTELSDGRRLRPRLRSLLSMSRPGSRSASSTSLAALTTVSSIVSETGATGVTQTSIANDTLQTLGTPVISIVPTTSALNSVVTQRSPDLEDQVIMRSPPRMQMRARPLPTSTLSIESIWGHHEIRPSYVQRSATAPTQIDVPRRGEAGQSIAKEALFDTMLPHELKVMIMRTLLDMGKSQAREHRWDGEIGARRDLIKISRVSKAWQALCFDGQLWPLMDLAPFASHLRPQTIRRIVDSSRDFITELSLRGMDALCARDLMPAIVGSSVTREAPYGFPNLTSLDLRGCKTLDPETIQALICAAPKLRSINLKGVQAVTSEVVRELARSAQHLESLDVSRCWNISLCDICVFLRTVTKDQAASIKVLRVGGLKAYGTAAADILPLVMQRLINLETLDLLGNTHIRDADFLRACECLESRPTPSPLQHLVLSGCTSLSSSIFLSMHSLFSNLTRLELASLPEMFDENGQGDKGFHKFLETLPNLEKLDLEGTGVKGGVNDKMLEALTSPKGGIYRLTDLQIGWAKGVTPEGMIRFIRATPSLRVFVADNTSATNGVMREFHRRHRDHGSISLIDCRAITAIGYSHLAPTSRPREGFTGYSAIPMTYEPAELEQKVVIKVFWSWRRVGVAKGWRETLKDREREHTDARAGLSPGSSGTGGAKSGKGKGWWKKDDPFDDRAGCVVQ